MPRLQQCAAPLLLATLSLQALLPESQAFLKYHNITSQEAICNDFSTAGFFIQESSASRKWIIFLESGGFCHSPESCNERFFHPDVRKREQELTGDESGFGSFDPLAAWERNRDRNLSQIVSPLMTSMYRFHENRDAFPFGRLTIDGRDIMNDECEKNPIFCEHNFVVIPYCSSDLWLGNDTRNFTTGSYRNTSQ